MPMRTWIRCGRQATAHRTVRRACARHGGREKRQEGLRGNGARIAAGRQAAGDSRAAGAGRREPGAAH